MKNRKSKNLNNYSGNIYDWNIETSNWVVYDENEVDLLLPNVKFNKTKEQIQHKDKYQKFNKRKLFFIVLFKCIKVKFHLFSFKKSFVKKLSINNFTLFSIGYIDKHHLNVYKTKSVFKYFTYTTI